MSLLANRLTLSNSLLIKELVSSYITIRDRLPWYRSTAFVFCKVKTSFTFFPLERIPPSNKHARADIQQSAMLVMAAVVSL